MKSFTIQVDCRGRNASLVSNEGIRQRRGDPEGAKFDDGLGKIISAENTITLSIVRREEIARREVETKRKKEEDPED